jgi:hypothetical protein
MASVLATWSTVALASSSTQFPLKGETEVFGKMNVIAVLDLRIAPLGGIYPTGTTPCPLDVRVEECDGPYVTDTDFAS